MKYIDTTYSAQLVNLHLDAYRKVISLAEPIKEVLRKFDGKVLNKRLDTALKAVDSGLSVNWRAMPYNIFEIEWFIENRCITTNPDRNGYCGAVYINEHTLSAVRCCDYDNCVIEGRINADQIIKALDEQMDEYRAWIQEAEDQLAHIDELQAGTKELYEAVKAHNKEISFIVDEYYGLRIDIR